MTERPSGRGVAELATLALAALALPVASACGEPGAAEAPGRIQPSGSDPPIAAGAAVPESAIVIRRATDPPHIDGTIDAVWRDENPRPIRVSVVGDADGVSDIGGDVRILYDETNLYLLFSVIDDSDQSDSALPFEDDAVEVYIDGGYERANYFDRNDWQFVFGRDGSWWVTADQKDLHPELRFAGSETATGYRVEVSIPWSGIGVEPSDGSAIGLEAHIDDDDDGDGVDAVLAWHAAGPSYEDASLMGAAVLGGPDGGPAVTPAPPANPGVVDPSAPIAIEGLPPGAGRDLPAAGAQEALNALSAREREAGFELLFDGESLDHWRGFRRDSVPEGWQAQEGVLVLNPSAGGGDLATREQFGDFELTLEWRVAEGGNSGIFFRATEDRDAPWETGPEMQVLDDERHSDGRDPLTSAGSSHSLYPAARGVVRPAGEWNRVRLVVDGDLVTHWLNDVQVVTYRLWSEDWEARVAASKFGRMPDYGRALAGHIVLQDHGDPVWYRNLKIRRLPERSPAVAEGLRVLVFSEARGHDHDTGGAASSALRTLAEEHGFEVHAADDSGVFTPHGLATYDVVVFLNTTGDVLNDAEQAAFEAYIRAGGGFVGVHSATDTEYDWAWYGGLVGAYFASHPSVQLARIYVTDTEHVSTRHLPATWIRTDEWYDFRDGPGDQATVVLELDESSYRGGRMGESHPIAWYHEYDGGRAFYTGIGHRPDAFSDPLFMRHLVGGIVWASGGGNDG